MYHPDERLTFIIQVDASDVAMVAVMLQEGKDGQLHPCAYVSKKFTTMERNWSVWDKEAGAVKLTLWYHLLEGTQPPFEIWTDHKNVEALYTHSIRSKKVMLG